MPEQIELCENCGRKIGNLESPHIHQCHVVCAECGDRLGSQAAKDPIIASIHKELASDSPSFRAQKSDDRRRMMAGVQPSAAHSRMTVGIELTNKKWKARWLVGLLIAIGSLIFVGIGMSSDSALLTTLGVIMVIAGIIFALAAQAGAWWENG